MEHSALIEDLAIILCFAGIVTVLFQKIKQPTVLGYLLAGIIIGPFTPPFSLIDDEKDIRILAELGVIFLMFSIGLEFSIRKLSKVGLSSLLVGAFEVVSMIIIGYFAGKLLGWSIYESLLLGAALSISSTTIIIKSLEEFNLKKQFFAHLMIGVLLIEDMLAILLMVFISTTSQTDSIFSAYVFWATLKLLGVVASWFLIGYFVVPYMMRKIQNYINHETLIIISIGLCLFLSSVAVYFHYSVALGSFIMGSILAETPQVNRIEALTLPIRDIFAAVFFVSVGMLIDPYVVIEFFPYILILSLVTIIGKLSTAALGTLLAGHSLSTALRIGFGMAQIGEFSFIIIGVGGLTLPVGDALYPIIVAIAVITTFTTPYLIKLSLKFDDAMEKKLPKSIQKMLKSYRSWVTHLHAEKQFLKGKDVARLVLNAIIVAILCTLSFNFLRPSFPPLANNPLFFPILAVITFIFASPFIWAMLFASRIPIIRAIGWIIASVELAFLTLPKVVSLQSFAWIALVLALYFGCFNHYLKRIYNWLEKQLIYNLAKRKTAEVLPKFIPWEYELVRLKINRHFPFIGKSLEESHLDPKYGLNIIAIKRPHKTVWLPPLDEKVHLEDELIIYGDTDEIDLYGGFTERIDS